MDPRCLREIEIRAGMTAVLALVFTLVLGMDLRIWLLPPAVALLVWLKWRIAPPVEDASDETDDTEPGP